jgi:hypothetical protein
MEASERPQLSFTDNAAGGTVRALDGRIVIESLTVDDERAAHLVRERQQLGKPAADTVRKAIEIGARVLDSEETAANVDYVRREVEASIGELEKRLNNTLDEGAETLAKQLEATFGIERSDSVQAQIKEIIANETRAHREQLLRTLTAEDGSNPLVAIQARLGKAMLEAEERHRREVERLREHYANESRAMQQRVAELNEKLARVLERQEADERVAEEAERGTAKGRSFEELVHAAVEEIAAGHGDAAHHTGDASNEAGGKKGDVVVEIGGAVGTPLATVVFEAKNKRLSRNEAWAELNGCMAERDAAYAVLVVAGEDKVPAGLDELTEYQGNKIIAVLDREQPDPLALRLVYRYVRARVLAAAAETLEVDAAGVRDAAEEAQATLKRANRIRKSLTGVTRSAETAREELDSMVGDVERCLERIESLVAQAAQGEAAAGEAP